VEFAKAEDRRIFIRVESSGGRPGIDVRPGEPPAINDEFTFRAVLSVLLRWLLHWGIFRGGWTVHIEAPDRDPIKIRCANRAEAEAYADRLTAGLKERGPEALDELIG
jgi:hypothetical protein